MKLQVAKLFTNPEWTGLIKSLNMSPRQAEISVYLLEGFGDKKIADELGISIHTVRTYLNRMFSKFDVQDRNELILTFFRHFRSECPLHDCPRYN